MSEPEPQAQDRPQDLYVTRNRPDPGQRPGSPRILQGLWGESDRPGYRRLYFTRALDVYAEFLADDVLSASDVGPERSPVLGEPATRVRLRGDALVDITRERRAETLSPFDIDLRIAGPITSAELDLRVSHMEPCLKGATPGDVICDSTQTCDTCFGDQTCAGFIGCEPGGTFVDCPPVEPAASNDLNPC
jgi:hypothetical protein